MTGPSKDPSVFDEPQYDPGSARPDPSEEKADRILRSEGPDSEQDRMEHNVWDEPGFSHELMRNSRAERTTYGQWLARKKHETSPSLTWLVCLLAAVGAGPWALLGAFFGSGQTVFQVLIVVLFAPVVEEAMKAAIASYVVEKKPYLFGSPFQIVVCVLCSGFCFAFVENLMYLNVYIPKPTAGLVAWRWSVCTVLHMGCSLIVGLGLIRVWKETWRRMERPRLSLGMPHLATAVAVHGVYNAGALALALAEFRF